VFWDVDKSRIVHHEVVPTTVLERFTVEVAVDVVLDLVATGWINIV
jgi:hypothetical protein